MKLIAEICESRLTDTGFDVRWHKPPRIGTKLYAIPPGYVVVPVELLRRLIAKLDETIQVYPTSESETGGYIDAWSYEAAQIIKEMHKAMVQASQMEGEK